MKNIILDTNFLMIPAQFKVDIFSEIERIVNDKYQIYVLKGTIEELNKIIKEQKHKHKMAAKLALKLIKAKGLKILDINQKPVDKILTELSKEYIIATQDKELKKEIKNKIILRQKKYLVLQNVLYNRNQ